MANITATQSKNKYNGKAYDHIHLFVYKGEKDLIKQAAGSVGMSVNSFIRQAILEAIKKV